MRLFLTLLILFSIQTLTAQYYYKDIFGTNESNQLFEKYRQLKVRSVVIISFEPDGNKSENFICEQTFTPSNRSLKTYTKSGVTDESTLISYYNEKGILKSTVDSSANIVSKSYYVFNEENKLLSFKNVSNEINKNFFETTEHFWFYNSDGKPVKMIRTTNINDTLLVNFIIDENGNVTEEKSFKKGKPFSTVYYYYDTQNRMTDIVRYNTKAKRLLPDYLFEYSDTNQLIQKITVPANNSNYQIWRYQYNSNGLRIKEALYDKYKKLTGKIEYQYRYG